MIDVAAAPGDKCQDVIIVGAGLAGTVLAMFLARRGLSVELLERSSEPARACASAEAGASSINLTLCVRGLDALDQIGVGAAVRERMVALFHRATHREDGTVHYQRYGANDEALGAVQREDLLAVLRAEALRLYGVRPRLGVEVTGVDSATGTVTMRDRSKQQSSASASLVIGADGAFSTVRTLLGKTGHIRESVERADMAYRQFDVRPAGGWTARTDALHLWPRGGEMLLAIPNRDGTFTAAALLPATGSASHGSLTESAAIDAHFRRSYPDAFDFIPSLPEQFLGRRKVLMVTVTCEPWSCGRILLSGGAAHAVVASYGQGANFAFEDCSILAGFIDESPGETVAAAARFARSRAPDARAIADLSLQHLIDLRSTMADPRFVVRSSIESKLASLYPDDYRPLYETVAFTKTPYREAVTRGNRWRPVVDKLCAISDAAPESPLPGDQAMHAAVRELAP